MIQHISDAKAKLESKDFVIFKMYARKNIVLGDAYSLNTSKLTIRFFPLKILRYYTCIND